MSGRLVQLVRDNWLFLLVIAVLAGVFFVLRTPGSPVSSVAEVDTLLKAGQPTVVEFYSNT